MACRLDQTAVAPSLWCGQGVKIKIPIFRPNRWPLYRWLVEPNRIPAEAARRLRRPQRRGDSEVSRPVVVVVVVLVLVVVCCCGGPVPEQTRTTECVLDGAGLVGQDSWGTSMGHDHGVCGSWGGGTAARIAEPGRRGRRRSGPN